VGETQQQLLVMTFNENAGGRTHLIYTVIVGEGIRPGMYAERMNHYTLLRTIEKAYKLPPLGRAAKARPLSMIWKKSPPFPATFSGERSIVPHTP
jgi:acid phosphatase